MQEVSGFGDMIRQYIGQNMLYLFVILGGILFLHQLKKEARQAALIAALLLLVAVFNPLSYRILVTFSGQTQTYYRFLWLIPCEMAVAYLLYESMQSIDNLKYRLVLICGICLGLLCLNTSREQWKLPENSYQISFDILEVAECLKSLRVEAGRSRITILADTDICHIIREYDASICFPFTDYHSGRPESMQGDAAEIMDMLTENRDNLNYAVVSQTLAANEIDYLIISINNATSLSYMQRLHWQIVATTSAYHILQYQEPVFTTDPLSAAGLETESVEIIIPGLTEEYHFLYLSDLHIITENEEISPIEQETVQSRQRWSSISEDITAAQFWESLPDILDSCNADALLLGGDMIDFCSSSNVECLKHGLERLATPYLYVRADHDSSPYYCEGLTAETCNSLHENIDGNAEVQYMEFPELYIIGLNNNTSQISESGFAQIAEILATEKPAILLSHVPYDSTLDTSLQDASKAVWQDRALIWGEDCYYSPDTNTQKLMDIIYADQSAIKEILCGHLHFTWDGPVTENTHEHVFSPAFEKKIGVINVKGK